MTIKYEYAFIGTEPRECDTCGYAAPLHEFEGKNVQDPDTEEWTREKKMLCELCAGSMPSGMSDYPDQWGKHAVVAGVICHVGNAILDAVRQETLRDLVEQLDGIGIADWAGAEGLDLTRARAELERRRS